MKSVPKHGELGWILESKEVWWGLVSPWVQHSTTL